MPFLFAYHSIQEPVVIIHMTYHSQGTYTYRYLRPILEHHSCSNTQHAVLFSVLGASACYGTVYSRAGAVLGGPGGSGSYGAGSS
jgi:hypothetical protein